MSVAGAIDSLLTHNALTVKSRASGVYDGSGRYVAGAVTQRQIRAVVQPPGAEMLQLLPEGRRAERSIAVWTTEQLVPATAPNGAAGDIIVYDGEDYEVVAIDRWFESGQYCHAIATRVTQ